MRYSCMSVVLVEVEDTIFLQLYRIRCRRYNRWVQYRRTSKRGSSAESQRAKGSAGESGRDSEVLLRYCCVHIHLLFRAGNRAAPHVRFHGPCACPRCAPHVAFQVTEKGCTTCASVQLHPSIGIAVCTELPAVATDRGLCPRKHAWRLCSRLKSPILARERPQGILQDVHGRRRSMLPPGRSSRRGGAHAVVHATRASVRAQEHPRWHVHKKRLLVRAETELPLHILTEGVHLASADAHDGMMVAYGHLDHLRIVER